MATFAIDYDGTISAHPELFKKFIMDIFQSGNLAVIVTMRYDDSSEHIPSHHLPSMPVPILYTGRRAKQSFCEDAGMKIDIWVDDKPHWIFQDSE